MKNSKQHSKYEIRNQVHDSVQEIVSFKKILLGQHTPTLLRKIVLICVHYCENPSFDLLNSLTKNHFILQYRSAIFAFIADWYGGVMWYENVADTLNCGQIYSRDEIVSRLKKEKTGLNENSYFWIVGNLVKDGLLKRTGRDKYSICDENTKNVYKPLYSEKAVAIKNKLEKKYPLVKFVIFETVLLNEFLNHQIAHNTIFIQTERDVSEFIFDYLRENTKTNMLYKPNQAEFDRYWQPESLIVTDLTSEAPMNIDSPHEITAEKMLVDIFCDKIINLTYGKSEYKSVVDEIYSRYQVDTARLLRYARRRNKEKEIMQFIDGK